jgi:hypothetical protein
MQEYEAGSDRRGFAERFERLLLAKGQQAREPEGALAAGRNYLRRAGHGAVRPMALRPTYCLVKASFALSATKEPAKTRRIHASTRGRLMTWSLTAAANAP